MRPRHFTGTNSWIIEQRTCWKCSRVAAVSVQKRVMYPFILTLPELLSALWVNWAAFLSHSALEGCD